MEASLIITCHNQGKYLDQLLTVVDNYCRDSVQLELIIIDSSDTPISRIANYVYHRIPNNGPSYARNFGASKASGKWLLFCDADDILNPSVFKRLPDLEASGFDVIFFDWKKAEDTQIVAEADTWYQKDFSISFDVVPLKDPVLFLQLFFPVHAVLLKRSLLEKVKFNEAQWFIEDVRFYLELSSIPGIRLGKCNAEGFTSFHRYFQNRLSLSGSNDQKFWEGVCSNYNYLHSRRKLSFSQKIAVLKLLVLSYHCVVPEIQQIMATNCEPIWQSFFGAGKLLKNQRLFTIATTITRSF